MNEIATWNYDAPKSYYFLKGYAAAKEFTNMKKALIIAKTLHEGQFRKGGAEYLVHPLRVCAYLIGLNFSDDILLSAALLHDVPEDVDFIRDNPRLLVEEYGISEEVLNVILLLTKRKDTSTEAYYDNLKKDWRSLLIKLSDRCNNMSTLQYFTLEKIEKYIQETEEHVLLLCSYGKLHFPECSDAITVMKYHITSLCSTIEAFIPLMNKTESIEE